MSANIRELFTGVSLKKQADISTLPGDPDFIFLTKTNPATSNVLYNHESDALDLGKGTEWPRNLYPAGIDAAVDFEKYLTSEVGVFLGVFALGSWNVVEEAPGIFLYSSTPLDPVTEGIELPLTAYAEGIRVTTEDGFFNRALIGCVVAGWTMEFTAGPGRAANKVTFQLVGSGRVEDPSPVAFPAVTYPEHPISLTRAELAGFDYVATKRLISLNIAYTNNIRLDQGYAAGGSNDGRVNGHRLRDRMEVGDRTMEIKLVARFEANSTEIYQLINQTEGSFIIWTAGQYLQPAGPAYYPASINFNIPKTRISTAVLGEENGIVTVEIAITAMQSGTTPLFEMHARALLAGVGTAATPRSMTKPADKPDPPPLP